MTESVRRDPSTSCRAGAIRTCGEGTAPKRNGGRHCCRPPLSLGPFVSPESEARFPREVPAEALRPRSVPQVPSQEYCYSGSGSCGSRSLPCGRTSVPWRDPNSPPCGFEIRFPIGRPRSEASRSSFHGSFRPGASGSAGPSKESGFGIGLRRRLALLPSGCPDLASNGFRPKTSAALRGAAAGSVNPFPEISALPQVSKWQRIPIRAKR
jgi:hypothetical protein